MTQKTEWHCLDDLLRTAMVSRGLPPIADAGAVEAVMPTIESWWPEEPQPDVGVEVDDGDGPRYSRWPGCRTAAEALRDSPEDEAAIRAHYTHYTWFDQQTVRQHVMNGVRAAVNLAGEVRRRQVLAQVLLELEARSPGAVDETVKAHCRQCPYCSAIEHELCWFPLTRSS